MICSNCNGTGSVIVGEVPFAWESDCPECLGTGKLDASLCTKCKGSGNMIQRGSEVDCDHCHGTGKEPKS